MTPKVIMIGDSIKAAIGAAVTLSLAAKPINEYDPLDLVGKVLWIIASTLAISWWAFRWYNEYKNRKK